MKLLFINEYGVSFYKADESAFDNLIVRRMRLINDKSKHLDFCIDADEIRDSIEQAVNATFAYCYNHDFLSSETYAFEIGANLFDENDEIIDQKIAEFVFDY